MISTIAKPLPNSDRMLVVLPSWLGDTVMATPALRALRRQFPHAHITYLGRPGSLALLADAPWADSAIQAPLPHGLSYGAQFFRSAKELARHHFDSAVLMPNSFGSALMATLAKIERRIGYDRDGRGMLLTDRLLPAKENGRFVPGPMIRYYLALAGYLGASQLDTTMELFTCPDDERAIESLFDQWNIDSAKGILLVHPGGGFGPSKRWPAQKYAQVADALVERFGLQLIITAGPKEADVAADLQTALKAKALNLAQHNISIGQLKALVRRSRLMIGNDTGPRHIAAAFSVPVVTIFGPTDPAWTDTFFDGQRIVRAKVSCGPCQKKTCKKESLRCMDLVTAEMVLAQAVDLLEHWPRGKA
ncbi:MAG: lipopolysaccharide heptosyltransferase II [Phycisphaerae bacterium]|nr:lipopolysaccharide heptosyltransferase II [Phycisphaerae bacterium]